MVIVEDHSNLVSSPTTMPNQILLVQRPVQISHDQLGTFHILNLILREAVFRTPVQLNEADPYSFRAIQLDVCTLLNPLMPVLDLNRLIQGLLVLRGDALNKAVAILLWRMYRRRYYKFEDLLSRGEKVETDDDNPIIYEDRVATDKLNSFRAFEASLGEENTVTFEIVETQEPQGLEFWIVTKEGDDSPNTHIFKLF